MAETLTCPSCSEPSLLTAVDRGGVVIDACPRCRGVWLDRGELDKLIALESSRDEDFLAEIRGGSSGGGTASSESSGHGSSGHSSKSSGYDGKKKRGGFLGDLFDLG
jgi:Zn-finger nucleic acid-binding protein